MFGFLIGTLSLIGLVKVARWGRYGHGRDGARRWMLRRLFQYLDTTPGQEKVIIEAVDGFHAKASAARDTLHGARGEYAKAVRGEHFDGPVIDEAFAKQQASLDEVKAALKEGLNKIHEALNADQRARLAELIEQGPARLHGCGAACGGGGRFARGPMGRPGVVNL